MQSQDDTERGAVEASTQPRFLVIGRITKPHGVRGEVRVMPHTDMPVRFTWLEQVYLSDAATAKPVAVEMARLHKNFVLMKLAGYDGREGAEPLRGTWLYIPEDEAIPLEEGEYFLHELLDLEVHSDEDQLLGTVVDVIETKANNVFVVKGALGEILLPDIDDVILDIDFENGRLTVHLLPGLLPNT